MDCYVPPPLSIRLATSSSAARSCAQPKGGLERSADPAQLKAILAEMIAVGPKTGPLSTQLAVNQAWAAAQQNIERQSY